MADKKIKVKVDVETNVAGSIAELKELKKQLKLTAAGSEDFKKLYGQIDDLEDKIKSAKGASSDWVDTLESAGGPLGMLGGALNKAKVATLSFGAAFKAIGIGLIVSAVAGLVAAFSQTEGAMKKLEPLLIGLEKIFGGIMAAFEPLLDAFLDMALKALPYITKGIGIFYSTLIGLFNLIKDVGVGAGQILKGIFTLDWDSVTAGYDKIKDAIPNAMDAAKAAFGRFEEGTKKLTKTEKVNQKERDELAKKALEEKIKRLEAEDKLDEAKLKKLKEEALSLAETEQEKLDIEKRFADLAYKAKLKDLEDRMLLYKKDSIEYKNLQVEKVNIEGDYIGQLTGFKDKQTQLTDAVNKDLLEKERKKAEDERGITASGLQAEFEALDKKNKLHDLDFEQDLIRIQSQRDILTEQEANDLSNTNLTEFQKTEIRKKYADARIALTDLEIQTEKSAMEAKHEINMAYLGLFTQFGNLLGQIAGKNKALAIAGIVISQAAAIGQIIANTGIANAKALAASPLTFGQPWVTINTISAGLSIASTIAAAAKSIQQINQTAGGAASGGAASVSGGVSVAMPTAPRVAGAAAPQIQTGGGQSATSQIGETLTNSQRPIRAWVVSGDITSAQSLDRRTNRAATFSGA